MTSLAAFYLWFLTLFGPGLNADSAPPGPPPPGAALSATDTDDTTRQQRQRYRKDAQRDTSKGREGIFNGF